MLSCAACLLALSSTLTAAHTFKPIQICRLTPILRASMLQTFPGGCRTPLLRLVAFFVARAPSKGGRLASGADAATGHPDRPSSNGLLAWWGRCAAQQRHPAARPAATKPPGPFASCHWWHAPHGTIVGHGPAGKLGGRACMCHLLAGHGRAVRVCATAASGRSV